MAGDFFSYKDLLVWQKAMDLVRSIYQLTRQFPDDERFGLISQMRRAAVSIPSNIAEGKSRRTGPDYRNFLYMASASGSELETQIIIARDLSYGSREQLDLVEKQLLEIKRMLSGLISTIS